MSYDKNLQNAQTDKEIEEIVNGLKAGAKTGVYCNPRLVDWQKQILYDRIDQAFALSELIAKLGSRF